MNEMEPMLGLLVVAAALDIRAMGLHLEGEREKEWQRHNEEERKES